MSGFSTDDSPTSSLPSSPPSSNGATPSSSSPTSGDSELHYDGASDSEYRAPLNGEAPEPSIDGTSVTGGEGGLRALSIEEVGDEEKKVSLASSWKTGGAARSGGKGGASVRTSGRARRSRRRRSGQAWTENNTIALPRR